MRKETTDLKIKKKWSTQQFEFTVALSTKKGEMMVLQAEKCDFQSTIMFSTSINLVLKKKAVGDDYGCCSFGKQKWQKVA